MVYLLQDLFFQWAALCSTSWPVVSLGYYYYWSRGLWLLVTDPDPLILLPRYPDWPR